MPFIPSIQTFIPIIVTFSNKTTSTVDYPASVKAILGEYPSVDVLYWDSVEQEYVSSNLPASRMEFTGDSIVISHGGAQSGIIKIY